MSFPYSLVDSHAHIFTTDLPMTADRRYTPGADATLPMYEAFLDQLGVRYGVLVQPSFLGADNEFLLRHLDACPQRLRGVVVVEPDTPLEQLQDMDRRGAVGLRLNLMGKPLPELGQTGWDHLLDFVRQHDWHVELHSPSHTLPALMPALLARGCRIVIDHFGRPDLRLGANDTGFHYLLETAASRQVWVKLSAPYRLLRCADDQAVLIERTHELLRHFGAERLLWGTDWPHSEHPAQLQHNDHLAFLNRTISNAETRRRILSDTPTHLFRFTPDVSLNPTK